MSEWWVSMNRLHDFSGRLRFVTRHNYQATRSALFEILKGTKLKTNAITS